MAEVYADKLKKRVLANYPSIDTRGPLDDMLLNPIGAELDQVQTNIDSLKANFTSEFDATKSAEDYESVGATYGVIRYAGTKASSYLILSFLKPPTGLVIPSGTIGLTDDGQYMYYTNIEFNSLSYTAADQLSAETGYYEYKVPITALEVGSKYNIAANRIHKLNLTLPSGTIVNNPEKIINGADAETLEDYWAKIKTRSYIVDISTQIGLATKATDFAGKRLEGIYVTPTLITKRSNVVTIYVAGNDKTKVTENIPIINSTFALKKRHVQSIESISVNGVLVTSYKILNDSILITQKLATNSGNVTVTYVKDTLASDIEDQLNINTEDYFGKKIEVHSGIVKYIEFKAKIRINSNVMTDSSQQALVDATFAYLNQTKFRLNDLTVQELVDNIFQTYQGYIKITVEMFQPKDETSYLQGFNIPCLAPEYLQIQASDFDLKFVAG
ncbi:baseplate J/gp47 family protein [Ewingella americana]|uniref:Baseplate protein J-like barrel domain-containing protein n=1 Tax=Ewingella americana TaxID=41202 RepID=A0A502GET4_9GAMM|nr:baseplate J/gp47 family protein [Ewingella americana]TPG60132.1 hypothetical protein EAH77_16315 [Ewingella americana]